MHSNANNCMGGIYVGYINAREVLPDDLIKKIHEYIEGVNIYIPKKDKSKKKKTINLNRENIIRDKEIFEKYKNGYKVTKLAEEYFLSTQGIYKIIAKQRS